MRVPFRVLFYKGAILYWGPKKGRYFRLENYPDRNIFWLFEPTVWAMGCKGMATLNPTPNPKP